MIEAYDSLTKGDIFIFSSDNSFEELEYILCSLVNKPIKEIEKEYNENQSIINGGTKKFISWMEKEGYAIKMNTKILYFGCSLKASYIQLKDNEQITGPTEVAYLQYMGKKNV